jgi:hypothetical protein
MIPATAKIEIETEPEQASSCYELEKKQINFQILDPLTKLKYTDLVYLLNILKL